MARNHARIVTDIWNDADFLSLTRTAQGMFMALLTQKKITMVGSLDYTPKRWASQAADLTVEDVENALEELEDRRFVLIDRHAEELVVRTFVRHDGGALGGRTRAAMWSAWSALASTALKRLVLNELPEVAWTSDDKGLGAPPELALQLRDTPCDTPSDRASDTPSDNPCDRGRYPSSCFLPPANHQEPSSPQAARAVPEGFREWWAGYPRKVDRADAERAFAKALKRGATLEQLTSSLAAWRKAWEAEDRDKRVIPHAATWLNKDRWADELEEIEAEAEPQNAPDDWNNTIGNLSQPYDEFIRDNP